MKYKVNRVVPGEQNNLAGRLDLPSYNFYAVWKESLTQLCVGVKCDLFYDNTNPSNEQQIARANFDTMLVQIRSRLTGNRTWTRDDLSTCFKVGTIAHSLYRSVKAEHEALLDIKHGMLVAGQTPDVALDDRINVLSNFMPIIKTYADNFLVTEEKAKQLNFIGYYPANGKREAILITASALGFLQGDAPVFFNTQMDLNISAADLRTALHSIVTTLNSFVSAQVAQAAADLKSVLINPGLNTNVKNSDFEDAALWLSHMFAGTCNSMDDEGYWEVTAASPRDATFVIPAGIANANIPAGGYGATPFWSHDEDGLDITLISGQAYHVESAQVVAAKDVACTVGSEFIFLEATRYQYNRTDELQLGQTADLELSDPAVSARMTIAAWLIGVGARKDYMVIGVDSDEASGTNQGIAFIVDDTDHYTFSITTTAISGALGTAIVNATTQMRFKSADAKKDTSKERSQRNK